ncbi:hypothetical protein [Sinorhizobium meliloti]|uniref:hypothetical protein n=1 Tax=Rhizobium meliloti TaxID=382 RepID=UPI001267B903|nr:hypothetical protein [Sinorhizobium meliloti]
MISIKNLPIARQSFLSNPVQRTDKQPNCLRQLVPGKIRRRLRITGGKSAKIHPDDHIGFDKGIFSVPHRLIVRTIQVRHTHRRNTMAHVHVALARWHDRSQTPLSPTPVSTDRSQCPSHYPFGRKQKAPPLLTDEAPEDHRRQTVRDLAEPLSGFREKAQNTECGP